MYPEDFAKIMKKEAGKSWRPSNHTEFEIFYGEHCANCVRDNPEENDMCEFISASMFCDTDESIEQWVIGEDGQPMCTAIATDKENPIKWVDPNQIDMFE